MATKTVTRTVKLYIDNKEIDNSVSSIRSEVKQLTAEMNKMTIGTDEYNAHMKRIAQLNGILDKHKSDLKGVGAELDKNNMKIKEQGSIFSNLSGNFTKYASMFTGFFATLTASLFAFNDMRKKTMEKESAAANLKALTGLDDNSIAWLTKQAEILSTTMDKSGLRIQASAKDILDAYTLVGSAKPELLNDKDALNKVTVEALRMASASKMEVKDAVEGLTLAMNQYGASADQASKYVNVLAAGAKFGSAEIANQTIAITKAGVAASTAKIPIEGLVGTIQTLAEKGIKDEVAGTGLKTFFLKLEAGAKETRPSVVGLSTALQRLKAAHLDASKMVDMFGLETYTVAQALIANADKVDYYTKVVTGTNAATEQAAINSNTAAAKYAQMNNEINNVETNLAKRLDPVFAESISLLQKIIKSVPVVIDWIVKSTPILITLTASIIAYNIAVRISIAQSKLKAIWWAIEDAALSIQILRYSVLNGTMTTTIALQKAFNIVLKANPFGLAVAAITALVTVFIGWEKTMADTQRYARELNETIAKEKQATDDNKTSIEKLLPIAQDATRSTNERNEAIKNLKKVFPGYFKNLDIETSKHYKVADAIEAANKQYLNKLRLIKKNADIEYLEALSNYNRNHPNGQQVVIPGAVGTQWIDQSEKSRLNALFEKRKVADKAYEDELNSQRERNKKISNSNSGNSGSSDNNNSIKNKKYWTDTLKNLTDQYELLSSAELKSKKGLELAKRISEVQKEIQKYDLSGSSKSKAETAENKRINKDVINIQAEFNQKKTDLDKSWNNRDIQDKAEYNARKEQLDMEEYQKLAEVHGLNKKESSEYSQKIIELKNNLFNKIRELDDSLGEDNDTAEETRLKNKYSTMKLIFDQGLKATTITQEKYNDLILRMKKRQAEEQQKIDEQSAKKSETTLEKQMEMELSILAGKNARGELSDKDYTKKSLLLQKKYLAQMLKISGLSADEQLDLQKKINENQNSIDRDSLEKRKERLQVYQEAMTNLMVGFAEDTAAMLVSSNESLKDYLKEVIAIMLDELQKVVMAQEAIVMIKGIAESLTGGWIVAALKIAAIEAAFAAAKAAISNFYDGGFTPSGSWDKPQGIVHSNEFVANRYATSNASLLPVLNLIDAAQKTGSVANLTSSDIAAVLPYSSRSNTSTVINNNNNNSNVNMMAMASLLANVHKSLQLINKRFSVPIVTETYASGKHGTIEATTLVNKMIKNASRNA